jgi:hypothetical protein
LAHRKILRLEDSTDAQGLHGFLNCIAAGYLSPLRNEHPGGPLYSASSALAGAGGIGKGCGKMRDSRSPCKKGASEAAAWFCRRYANRNQGCERSPHSGALQIRKPCIKGPFAREMSAFRPKFSRSDFAAYSCLPPFSTNPSSIWFAIRTWFWRTSM